MNIPRVVPLIFVVLAATVSPYRCAVSANVISDAFRKTAVCFVFDVTTITAATDDEFRAWREYVRERVLPGWDLCLIVTGPESYEMCRISGRDKAGLLRRMDEVMKTRARQQKFARSGRKRPQGSYIVEAIIAATDYLNGCSDHKRKLFVVSDCVAQTPQRLDVGRLVSHCPRFTGDGPVDLRICGMRSDLYSRLSSVWVPRLKKDGVACDLQPESREMHLRDIR